MRCWPQVFHSYVKYLKYLAALFSVLINGISDIIVVGIENHQISLLTVSTTKLVVWHPYLSVSPNTPWRKLVSAACISDLILLVTTQSSWPKLTPLVTVCTEWIHFLKIKIRTVENWQILQKTFTSQNLAFCVRKNVLQHSFAGDKSMTNFVKINWERNNYSGLRTPKIACFRIARVWQEGESLAVCCREQRHGGLVLW